MVKPSSTKVEAAPSSTMKPVKKGKREAEDDLDIQVPKKHKKELIPQKAKAVPKKIESSSSESSDSSDSEEEDKEIAPIKKPIATAENSSSDESSDEEPTPEKKKAESSSEDDSSSDEETAPVVKKQPAAKVESSSSAKEPTSAKKQPTVVKQAKIESSSSEDESSSDEETAPVKKQPAAPKNAEVEKSSSEDESSSDEETAPVKKQPIAPKNAEAEKSSSEDESSSDEESTPALFKNAKPAAKDSPSSEEDSDDEESDDEKPPMKKAKVSVTNISKQESFSEESDEEIEDEKVTPKKKVPSFNQNQESDVEMVEAEQKSIAEQPKTPTTQTQGGSKTLFVGNLSYKVERSDVENFFKEVVDVRFTSDEEGTFKGYGHVEFATAEAAQKALELNGTSLLGRDVRLDLARERGTPRSSNARNYQSGEKGVGSQSKTIFVKGFDTSIGEDEIKSDLRAHFGACGEVARIVLPTDPESGVIKGIAFIDLKDGYNKALQLRGSEIRGRKIDVQEGRPRANSAGDSAFRFSNNKRGRGPRGRDQGRGPRGRDQGRGSRGRDQGRGPRGREPSKPSLIASAQGKKTVFNEDE